MPSTSHTHTHTHTAILIAQLTLSIYFFISHLKPLTQDLWPDGLNNCQPLTPMAVVWEVHSGGREKILDTCDPSSTSSVGFLDLSPIGQTYQ